MHRLPNAVTILLLLFFFFVGDFAFIDVRSAYTFYSFCSFVSFFLSLFVATTFLARWNHVSPSLLPLISLSICYLNYLFSLPPSHCFIYFSPSFPPPTSLPWRWLKIWWKWDLYSLYSFHFLCNKHVIVYQMWCMQTQGLISLLFTKLLLLKLVVMPAKVLFIIIIIIFFHSFPLFLFFIFLYIFCLFFIITWINCSNCD